MEILNATLVSLGLASPLLIAMATAIFYLLRSFIDKRFEMYKEVSIEKLKHELEIRSLDSQHKLSIEYDRIRNIHDNQKEKLTSILQELNTIVSTVFEGFNYEENEFPLANHQKVLQAKRKIYSDGLYIDSLALELVSAFFDLAESNSTVIYETGAYEEAINFDLFDYRLLELIQNEIFFRFRYQIGIESEPTQSATAEAALALATLASLRSRIENKKVKSIFPANEDIMLTISRVKEDRELRSETLSEILRLKALRKLKWKTPREIERLVRFFSDAPS